MKLRELFEAALIEVNKRKAPSLLREDFNYFIMKSIYAYINIGYLSYDKDQQSVDDLNELKVVDYSIPLSFQGLRYKGSLPTNYLHILNCQIEFKANTKFSCYKENDVFLKSAQRIPTSSVRFVENNFYLKPSYKKPYFYSNGDSLELRTGDASVLVPQKAYIDYLKIPETVILTEVQLESVEDISQEMQFSHTVCLRIINELIKLLLENTSDPRLQTNIPVNQTVPPTR